MQFASLQAQWQALIAACKDVASLEEALGPESIQHAIGHDSGLPATARMAELSATIAASTTRSHLPFLQNENPRLRMTEDLGSHVLPCFKHFLLGMHLILARPITTQAPLNATGSTKRLCAASESCLKQEEFVATS